MHHIDTGLTLLDLPNLRLERIPKGKESMQDDFELEVMRCIGRVGDFELRLKPAFRQSDGMGDLAVFWEWVRECQTVEGEDSGNGRRCCLDRGPVKGKRKEPGKVVGWIGQSGMWLEDWVVSDLLGRRTVLKVGLTKVSACTLRK